MRSSAKIDKIPALVGSDFTIFGYFRRDQRYFERVGGKELKGLLFGQDESGEGLRFASNLLGALLDCFVVFVRENLKLLYFLGQLTSLPVYES